MDQFGPLEEAPVFSSRHNPFNMTANFHRLPREVIRNIALQLYDPLVLTQQDRLTWGIFSTVDMHQERQDALLSLINFGSTCRKVRREVRVILFRCIRIPTIAHAEEVVRNRDDWAKFVNDTLITNHPYTLTSPSTNSVPFAARLKSFGWRQRAPPPGGYRTFSQASTFVSTLHLLRHAYDLSFLVLDADMDVMEDDDVLAALRELNLRSAPSGEEPALVSLMLCGQIKGWDDGFLQRLVDTFSGIKELFIDRPLGKGIHSNTTVEELVAILEPLKQLNNLRLIQLGSYTFSQDQQRDVVSHLASIMPQLIIVGLLGGEGETNWWGIWRKPRPSLLPSNTESTMGLGTGSGAGSTIAGTGTVFVDTSNVYMSVQPLGDGHLRILEARLDGARPTSVSGTSTPLFGEQQEAISQNVGSAATGLDVSKSPQSIKMSLDHLLD